jgi:hypothetical protein
MRRRSTFWYSPSVSRWYREHRLRRRYPERYQYYEAAAQLVGSAVNDPITGVRMLSRVGMSFSRWELLRLRFWSWVGQTARSQRIILRALKRDIDRG